MSTTTTDQATVDAIKAISDRSERQLIRGQTFEESMQELKEIGALRADLLRRHASTRPLDDYMDGPTGSSMERWFEADGRPFEKVESAATTPHDPRSKPTMTPTVLTGEQTTATRESYLEMWELQELTWLVNEDTFAANGERATCIQTSYALVHVLRSLGWAGARIVRVSARPDITGPAGERQRSGHLGRDFGGPRRKQSADGWLGHCCVETDRYVLDATLDQINPDLVPPTVYEKPIGWDDASAHRERYDLTIRATIPVDLDDDGNPRGQVWHWKYHKQSGWKSAQVARPKYWKPTADAALSRVNAIQAEPGYVSLKYTGMIAAGFPESEARQMCEQAPPPTFRES